MTVEEADFPEIKERPMHVDEAQHAINNAFVKDDVLYLAPGQLDPKIYKQVKKKIEGIGGKWKGGKVSGYLFPKNTDIESLLKRIQGGEKLNLKKEQQAFMSPLDVAQQVVMFADIQETDEVCEPSAGEGAIVKEVHKIYPEKIVDCYEINDARRKTLENYGGLLIVGSDFINSDSNVMYDKIVANPPFSKNQDITHVMKMYDRLKPGGRISSVMSNHWRMNEKKKETAFREFVDGNGYIAAELPSGSFKESGTMVAACIVVIDKPENIEQ